MSTNYYLRSAKPREVYDEFHIGKTSWGWKPHFQDSTDSLYDRSDNLPNPPVYHSIADIRNLIASGDYALVSEYGEPADLDEVLTWADGHPDWRDNDFIPGSYRDPEGYIFTSTDFS